MNYKIFDRDGFGFGYGGRFMQRCIDDCLREGYVPADARTVSNMYTKQKLPGNKTFFTRTIVGTDGLQKTATITELKNMLKLMERGYNIIAIGGGCVNELSYCQLDKQYIHFIGIKSSKRGK